MTIVRKDTILGRLAIVTVACQFILLVIAFLLFFPPIGLFETRLSQRNPYGHLPLTRLHEIYGDQTQRVLFNSHRDFVFDWTKPVPHWLYHLVEQFAQLVEIDLPARVIPPPLHLMHVMQGAARLQVVRTVVLLGIPDLLADRVLSLADLCPLVQAKGSGQDEIVSAGTPQSPDTGYDTPSETSFLRMPCQKLERLMQWALTFGYFAEVGYDGSHIYSNNAQSGVLKWNHPNNMNHLLFHFSNEAYLGWHRLYDTIISDDNPGSLPGEVVLFGGLAMDATFAGEHASSQAKQALRNHERAKAERLAHMKAEFSKPTDGNIADHPRTAWFEAHGQRMWEFYEKRPHLQRNFQQSMSDVDRNVNRALLADYEWNTLQLNNTGETKSVQTIIDVGGAEGAFLSNILSFPSNAQITRGILFDLRSNIEAAKKLWLPTASSTRGELTRTRQIDLIEGDFFDLTTIPLPHHKSTPTKYVLRQILHDWSDQETVVILDNFRQRLQDHKNVALVLVEVNRPASEGLLVDDRRSPGEYSVARPSAMRSFIDGQMMICCNARERSPEQWKALFDLTGWKLVRQVQTRSVFIIMELQPAEVFENSHPNARGLQEKEDL